jgi:hypothetical protein
MKKIILLLACITGLCVAASAQAVKVIPAYWVVETNVKHKNFSIVRMYDDQHNLIHEVTMKGVYLNVNKVRHRRMLDELVKGYYPVAQNSSSSIQGPALFTMNSTDQQLTMQKFRTGYGTPDILGHQILKR